VFSWFAARTLHTTIAGVNPLLLGAASDREPKRAACVARACRVRIFAIPRSSVGAITPGSVMDQLQQQQRVYVSIHVPSAPNETVPVLMKGIFGGLQGSSKAPSIFIQTWNDGVTGTGAGT
jgi:hypothetical protein